ncbi:MAG: SDR family oxidoreductase [Deltaproteobacteria bacterium]|nr:SDR family oxidoreductase [Deltaproteobacteria bacterium]
MDYANSPTRDLAVITGASSGIGREFAIALAERCTHDLLLVARRTDRLESLAAEVREVWAQRGAAAGTVNVLTADLTTDEGIAALTQAATAPGRVLGLLVNNAGFGHVGPFLDSTVERDIEMTRLNCIAPLRLMHALLPSMRAAHHGVVLNVCSVVSFMPLSYMSTYAATKSFFLSLTLGVNQELRGSGVRLMALCPGPTESEFHIAAGLKDALDVFPAMSARTVVEQALRGVERKRSVVVNGFLNTLVALTAHVVGPRAAAWIARPVMRRYLTMRGVPLGSR